MEISLTYIIYRWTAGDNLGIYGELKVHFRKIVKNMTKVLSSDILSCDNLLEIE
jgi:hypothetical protein